MTNVNINVARPGDRPARFTSDVTEKVARHILGRIAAMRRQDPGVVVALERNRLVIDSKANGSTVYTIAPVTLARGYRGGDS